MFIRQKNGVYMVAP